MKQRMAQICLTTAELALHYGGIGGCVPNKRSAGSKTIALLANANCFTSALLASMGHVTQRKNMSLSKSLPDATENKQESMTVLKHH